MKYKNKLKKIFEPSSEKVFVAAIPFIPIIPIIIYLMSDFILGHEGALGQFFYLAGFVSYGFMSLFAIPFEGILGFLGMMDFGGGIFEIGIKGMNIGGIIFVQFIYSAIFYSIYSITSHFRVTKKMRYSFGRK